jgi:site-specific DNA recombinase
VIILGPANHSEQIDEASTVSAALYARTSSPNQKHNYSISEQVERCLKYCEQRGWEVHYTFIDECESGGTIERPKFQLMLDKAEAGKFHVIVFWKLDRFCRSLVDLVNLERKLREWSVNLCSVTEFIDTTTSVGRFNFRNLASVAEFEREIIGERARIGLHALAKKHLWPNPHPPLGYDKASDGRLVGNPNEVKLIMRIFTRYLETRSMPQVAFELNQAGILTKKLKRWNARAIHNILTNRIYVGRYSVASFSDYVDDYKILENDLFDEVTRTRLRYKRGKVRRPSMPKERKLSKIDTVFDRYQRFLRECSDLGKSSL